MGALKIVQIKQTAPQTHPDGTTRAPLGLFSFIGTEHDRNGKSDHSDPVAYFEKRSIHFL
jgi:hypothetical protein